jgi:feruloyl esterase
MGTSLYLSGKLSRATPHVFKDSGYRSTHDMTVIAKRLIEAYYGRPASYAYFIGYSAGGKQGFSSVQRYPEDYDGVIAGVPSNNALPLVTYFLWNYVHLTTREGWPLINTATAERIADEAAAFFRLRGCGAEDGNYVPYSWCGENTVEDFLAHLSSAMPMLSAEQISALRAVYTGPVNPKNGKRIYTGLPIGAEPDCGYMRDADKPRYFDFEWFRLFFGEDFCPHDFDFADDYEAMHREVAADFTFNDPDLSRFAARGGRFLIFSGISDSYGPWADAVHYYNGVCEALGGYERAKENVRLFLLPGKGHSIRGRGTNAWWADDDRAPLLRALRAWREEGKAPDYLVAAHIEKTEGGEEKIGFWKHIPPYAGDKRVGSGYPAVTDPTYALPTK